jgi:two-component system LytT family sensor kinase
MFGGVACRYGGDDIWRFEFSRRAVRRQEAFLRGHEKMKSSCEGCQRSLPADAEAYVCSYECTYCAECATIQRNICPHCGGELVRRPRRRLIANNSQTEPEKHVMRTWLVWAISFGVWTLIAFAGAVTMYQFDRMRGRPTYFGSMLALELSQVLTYAPLTPFVFQLASRYPFQRGAWQRRLALYLLGSLIFTLAHVALRGLTYDVWDMKTARYASATWDSQAHALRIRWDLFQSLFYLNVVDDITGTYVPIVLIAHVVSYYQRFRQRELRTSQLQAQLAKARLQALKSQLQPHFLFNTMHSISALMLTDVHAADRMMTRLSDLLRINLEAATTQITTLSRELEFVNCYLDIEKVRFEERLSVIFEIAPETLDAQVPHLLLQPLVDNAVKHGISKLATGGEIRITASAPEKELLLEVKDNGPGLGATEVRPTAGVGLRVTRERLESLYGENHSLEVASPLEGGVTVRVSIPLRLQPAEERPDAALATSRQTEQSRTLLEETTGEQNPTSPLW